MRNYALTYPQLANQAIGLGFESADLLRLRTGFDLAQGMTDGLYRKQGVPFLCHFIRTASIVMTEVRSMDAILAALLHASYFLHYFKDSTRRGPRPSDRRFLRAQVGNAAEQLIDAYGELRWNEPGVMVDHATQIDQHPPKLRTLLLLKLANELEDHLDAAMSHSAIPRAQHRYVKFGAEYIELANAMGLDEMATDLREAFDFTRKTEIPKSLAQRHTSSYELKTRLFTANPIERVGSALRRYRDAG